MFKYGLEDKIASCKPAMPAPDYIDCYIDKYGQTVKLNQEGSNPMCFPTKAAMNSAAISINTPTSVEATQRDFFSARVRQIQNRLEIGLRKQFYLDAEEAPQTAADLIKRIKDDDFTLDQRKLDNHADELHYYNSFFGIRWGKNTPDKAGYKAAVEALKEEAQSVTDKGTLSPVDSLLGLLETFQKWTYKADAKKK